MSDSYVLGFIVVTLIAGVFFLLRGRSVDSKKDEEDAKSQSWRGSGGQNVDPVLRNSQDRDTHRERERGGIQIRRVIASSVA